MQFKYLIRSLQLFQILLILIRNILRPRGRYLPCVRRYGIAIVVAPNGQSPREGKGNTSETVSGFLEYIHPSGKAADSRFGVAAGYVHLCRVAVDLQKLLSDQQKNQFLETLSQKPTLHTHPAHMWIVYACVGFQLNCKNFCLNTRKASSDKLINNLLTKAYTTLH